MTDTPTKFTEANALLAAQEGDMDEVRRLVADMLPGERRRLANACRRLEAECDA